MSITNYINDGLEYAKKDIIEISSRNDRFDVKPKEDQVKCALYRVFTESGYLAHIEPGNYRNGGRCDIVCIEQETDKRYAVEIKTAWAGKGWVNKPKEQADSWRRDIERLKAFKNEGGADECYFILCFAYQKESNAECRLREKISEFEGMSLTSFSIDNWNGLNEVQFFVMRICD